MATLDLPKDLKAFLEAGVPLEYDAARYQPGEVSLLALSGLVIRTIGARISQADSLADDDPHTGERGYYLVPAVSLVGTCQNYRPQGILLWLLEAGLYASWDDDHRTLWAFPGITWSEIVAAPPRYLNACWEPGLAGARQLPLWETCQWQP